MTGFDGQTDTDTEQSDSRVTAAHEALAALLHAGYAHDPQANPSGFRRAAELGLVETDRNAFVTPLGRGVLRALGCS